MLRESVVSLKPMRAPALSLCMRRILYGSCIRSLFFGYDVWLKLFHDLVHVVSIVDI